MKKLAILSMTVIFLMTYAQLPAQEATKDALKTEIKESKKVIKTERKELRLLEGNEVNELTKSNFITDFGEVPNIKWARGDFMDEAEFVKSGKEMKAYYDADSKLIGTVSIKNFTDLPLKAQNTIKAKYKDYAIQKVIYFDDNEGNDTDIIFYNTRFEDYDCYYVELSKAEQKFILQVDTDGESHLFKIETS